MNWDAISAIGQMMSALAVIVTLVYLAVQIKQNTAVYRVGVENQWNEFNAKLCHPVALDRQTAEWWCSGETEFDSMDTVDQKRLFLWEYSAFENWLCVYRAKQQGLVSDQMWRHQIATMKAFATRDSVLAAWQNFSAIYDDDFRKLMDSFIPPYSGPHSISGE